MRAKLALYAALATALAACQTPSTPGSAIAPIDLGPVAEDSSISRLLTEAGASMDPELGKLAGQNEAQDVRSSLEAYRKGDALKSILFAQAAVGADPGNAWRRRLLRAIAIRTAIEPDPEGLLPLRALIQHELRRAESAFYDSRYGTAVQACRRALLLDPENAGAWTRLGSASFALGDAAQARSAYAQALRLNPKDAELRSFLQERGWN